MWRNPQAIEVDLSPDIAYPTGAWQVPPQRAAIVPIAGHGSERPLGALVVGLNPYRPGDADYLSYLGLLAGQVSSSLAGARIYEGDGKTAASGRFAVPAGHSRTVKLHVTDAALKRFRKDGYGGLVMDARIPHGRIGAGSEGSAELDVHLPGRD